MTAKKKASTVPNLKLEAMKVLVADLMRIESRLNGSPCMRVARGEQKSSCSMLEFDAARERVRSWDGRGDGPSTRRDPEKMCDECAALEHVQRALERLREREAWLRRGVS